MSSHPFLVPSSRVVPFLDVTIAAKAAGQVVSLTAISTIASTLGALAVTSATLESSVETHSFVVSDKDTVDACVEFSNSHRLLVEPACGAALAVVLLDKYRKDTSLWPPSTGSSAGRRVVIICCGGSAVSLELLAGWRERFA
jgi:L-serine/L-threonine ammonia-lyase